LQVSQNLIDKKCKPCEGGVMPLAADAANKLMEALNPAWHIAANSKQIYRDFSFPTFVRTMEFVNAVAQLAEAEDHHPELEVSYGKCVVNYTTHAIDGLSENDFICAAKIDRLP
jgi:4a-hydroxytetrahydrobiopterin dehydratase